MATGAEERIGTELAGYRIDRLLGRGGMGVVYLAQDTRLNRPVALKLVAPELTADPAFRARFLREAELAASLDHSHVVPVYGAGESEGRLWLAMRYVDGTDLATLLEREGPLDPERTSRLIAQVASALEAAHTRGLVHRDIKPANVLVTTEDREEHCYLADFGLARAAAPESGHAVTGLSGTADYTAPEQFGEEPTDYRADVYALACVLFECLAGEPPFRRSTPETTLLAHIAEPPPSLRARRPDLPEGIDRVIVRGLAKRPAERYTSCSELSSAAHEALGLEPRRFSRRAVIAMAGVGAAVAVGAGVAIPLALRGPRRRPAPSVGPTLAITRDTLQRIDPDTNALTASIALGGDLEAVAAGGGAVYVTDHEAYTVRRITAATNTVTRTASTGGDATDVAFGFDAVWVANNAQATVAVLDPFTLAVRTTLQVGSRYGAGPLVAGQRRVWCGGEVRDQIPGLWGLTKDATPLEQVAVALPFWDIAADRGELWMAAGLLQSPLVLREIDETAGPVDPDVALDFVFAGGIAAGDGAVWITDTEGGRLVRVDASARAVSGEVAVGARPNDAALGGGSVWVANYDDGTVSRVDPATLTVTSTIEVGPKVDRLVFDEGSLWALVHA